MTIATGPHNVSALSILSGIPERTLRRWLLAGELKRPSPIPQIAYSSKAVYRNVYGRWRIIPDKLQACCGGVWPT